MAAKAVGLGLVHWNSGTLTERCVESVLAGTVKPSRIAVFDNGSFDGAATSLVKNHPDIVLLRSDKNLGFAHAANSLITFLESKSVDFIWLLNNDTIVEPTALESLIRAMESEPSFSACSSKIVLQSDSRKAWYAGGHLDHRKIEGLHDVDVPRGSAKQNLVPVDFLSGCCMFLRIRAIGEVGTFDESFFAYCEDADWCFRAKEKGIRLGYVPSAVIHHAVSASIRRATLGRSRGTASRFQQFLTFRSSAILIRKYAPSASMRRFLLAALTFRGIAVMIGQILLGRFEKVPAVVTGIRCGILDSLGTPLRQDLVARFAPATRNIRGDA